MGSHIKRGIVVCQIAREGITDMGITLGQNRGRTLEVGRNTHTVRIQTLRLRGINSRESLFMRETVNPRIHELLQRGKETHIKHQQKEEKLTWLA